MTAPTVTAKAIPTGGAITLTISGAVSGAFTLSRAVSGTAGFIPIASGQAPMPFFIDAGDGLPAPLQASAYYQYQYTDVSGTQTTGFIQPASSITIYPDPVQALLIRLIQGAINSMVFPNGVKKAQVTNAMPLGGNIPMPLVVVNLELGQQSAVPIGQSLAANAGSALNQQLITGFARRVFRVSVLAPNQDTSDFYRDAIVGVFEALYAPVLLPLGLDVTHRWQFNSGQVADDRQAKMPGFYFAEVMLEFEGTLNVLLTTNYGLIETLSVGVSGSSGDAEQVSVDVVTMPVSGV